MGRLTIIDEQSIPLILRDRSKSPRMIEILDTIKNLESNKAVRYQCDDVKQAKYLQTTLIYHSNRRHRPGTPAMPGLRSCQRENIVFIWLEKEQP